ncbi:MAG: SsrA-binding protein SmpB [Candidatus Promineifilaceae bacterium]|nr:SsrA-binding protein SmpB [Candidatus Promineifilaceae bacterium]
MSKTKKKPKGDDNTIAVNRKARHEYQILDTYEAGLVLEGWEVKSLREGKINLSDTYVLLRDGEAFLLACRIEPLKTVSTHITPDPMRTRKLLLHERELGKLFDGVQKDGLTCIPLSMYWIRGRAKLKIGLAQGKKQHDKRATEKERDWKRQKQRLLRQR